MSKIEDTIELFQSVEPAMRLELLLDYSERLPPLDAAYVPLRDAGLNLVHECQSPVFLMVDVVDGKTSIVADVPREAPTARGFTSLMMEAFNGQPARDVEQAPLDMLGRLGLSGLIGMQRTRGLSGIYHRIRKEVALRSAQASDHT